MHALHDFVEQFLAESHEDLDQLDADLLALQGEPDPRERLSRILRSVRAIEGTSRFLAFDRLQEVTRVGGTLVTRLRDGELGSTPARTDVLLRMADTVRSLLTSIEAVGSEGRVAVSALVEAIGAATEDTPARAVVPAPRPAAAEAPAPAAPAAAAPAEAPAADVTEHEGRTPIGTDDRQSRRGRGPGGGGQLPADLVTAPRAPPLPCRRSDATAPPARRLRNLRSLTVGSA